MKFQISPPKILIITPPCRDVVLHHELRDQMHHPAGGRPGINVFLGTKLARNWNLKI